MRLYDIKILEYYIIQMDRPWLLYNNSDFIQCGVIKVSTFAARLTELREARNMQQNELSAILHVSPGTISNYESGRHNPDFATLIAIADFYQVSLDYLLGRSDSKAMIGSQKYTKDVMMAQAIDLLCGVSSEYRQSLMCIMAALGERNRE